ncbi:MAG: hypothetical protein ACPGVO_11150 [Spirulinaceae cyanobacterium]
MPSSIAAAFNQFLTSINPPPETITLALATRKRLFTLLEKQATLAQDFPALAPQHLDISPIFRKTQTRPLQQLTLLLLLQAPQLETFPSPIFPQIYWLKLIDIEGPFRQYRDEHDYFSSTVLLQGLGQYFADLPQLTSTVTAEAVMIQCDRRSCRVR